MFGDEGIAALAFVPSEDDSGAKVADIVSFVDDNVGAVAVASVWLVGIIDEKPFVGA